MHVPILAFLAPLIPEYRAPDNTRGAGIARGESRADGRSAVVGPFLPPDEKITVTQARDISVNRYEAFSIDLAWLKGDDGLNLGVAPAYAEFISNDGIGFPGSFGVEIVGTIESGGTATARITGQALAPALPVLDLTLQYVNQVTRRVVGASQHRITVREPVVETYLTVDLERDYSGRAGVSISPTVVLAEVSINGEDRIEPRANFTVPGATIGFTRVLGPTTTAEVTISGTPTTAGTYSGLVTYYSETGDLLGATSHTVTISNTAARTAGAAAGRTTAAARGTAVVSAASTISASGAASASATAAAIGRQIVTLTPPPAPVVDYWAATISQMRFDTNEANFSPWGDGGDSELTYWYDTKRADFWVNSGGGYTLSGAEGTAAAVAGGVVIRPIDQGWATGEMTIEAWVAPQAGCWELPNGTWISVVAAFKNALREEMLWSLGFKVQDGFLRPGVRRYPDGVLRESLAADLVGATDAGRWRHLAGAWSTAAGTTTQGAWWRGAGGSTALAYAAADTTASFGPVAVIGPGMPTAEVRVDELRITGLARYTFAGGLTVAIPASGLQIPWPTS